MYGRLRKELELDLHKAAHPTDAKGMTPPSPQDDSFWEDGSGADELAEARRTKRSTGEPDESRLEARWWKVMSR